MSRTGLLLSLLVALCVLQIFLSKRKNKWVGLILPLIAFIFSILLINISTNFIGLVIANIPTIIFLIIYFVCQKEMNVVR
jgi:branched-subunit amino acid transport protein